MRTSSFVPSGWTRELAALAGLLIVLTSSCKLISTAANAPSKVASGLSGGSDKNPPPKVPPNVLQAEVMRFADTFAGRITQATRDFTEKVGTPEAHIQALTWCIGQNTSAITIATGNNPNVATLDMIVLTTLGRMTHEGYWLPKVWGEADRPMLVAFQDLEKAIWDTAEHVLSPAQQEEVRATLREWSEQNPDMGATAFIRLPAFKDIIEQTTGTPAKKSSGLGDLLSVDPLGGLDPAVREIEQTRLLAERAMFYVQRAPLLLALQVELLSMSTLRLPEVHSALEDTQRISHAALSLSDTAAKLPDAVRVEREAAVKQVSDVLTSQREGIMADLEKAQPPVSKLLTDARATLDAGSQLSTALQGTVVTVDKFLDRFEKKEPPSAAPPPPPAEPGKPFDIVEYGDAATRIGATVRDINGLVTNLDQSLPKVQRVLDEAAQRGNQTIDYAFERVLLMGGILIAAVGLAVLGVRWISARSFGTRARQAVG